MIEDLIYDVGMHNGDDTAYYLARGFRVVAIEANPVLAEQARQRFRREVGEGRLDVLNVAIAESAGTAEFFVNERFSGHSSFDRAMAGKWGGNVVSVSVQCVPFEAVLAEHGVPYYLKVDIEGADSACLQALSRVDLPRYVSAEAHSFVPLCQLVALGYDQFKCINQAHHNDPDRSANTRTELRRQLRETQTQVKAAVRDFIGRNRLGSAIWENAHATKATVRRGMRFLQSPPARSHAGESNRGDQNRVEHQSTGTNGATFAPGSSGPFGEDTWGSWQSAEEIAYDWLHLQMGRPNLSRLAAGGWFDFHARRSHA